MAPISAEVKDPFAEAESLAAMTVEARNIELLKRKAQPGNQAEDFIKSWWKESAAGRPQAKGKAAGVRQACAATGRSMPLWPEAR